MTSGEPAISVIIPTHNRRASLFRLLSSLANGTLPPDRFEVIAVADGCTDDTIEALRDTFFPFEIRSIAVDPGRGAATARNLGARAARAPILLFIDDDIEPFPGLLEAHLREHAAIGTAAGRAHASVVIGAPLPVRKPACGFREAAIWGWWDQQFERMELPGHRFSYDEVFGGILSLPRPLFEEVGEFDEAFNGCREDPELGLRLIRSGARIVFSRAGGGHHHEVRTLPQMLVRKRAEGRSDVLLAERYPEIWPTLRVSSYAGGPASLRLLRWLALHAPRVGQLLFAGNGRALDFLERLRFRSSWRAVHAATMYFTYWCGVGQQLGGGRRAVEQLAALSRAAARAARKPDPMCEIDLSAGLPTAEALLDQERPTSAWIRLQGIEVGVIPQVPGSERLAGRHLRRSLLDWLAEPMRSALALRHLMEPGTASRAAAAAPSFSIIVPAFDAETTLAKTLDSVLAQTEAGWELIVVDDGSRDGTGIVAAEYAAKDPRIRLIHQRRQGPSAARNAGIRETSGEWILFLDADDWIAPSLLERARDALAGDLSLDGVHCGWEAVEAGGGVLERRRCTETGELFPSLARQCLFPIHACVVRRRFVVDAGGFPVGQDRGEDWLLWQRVARLGARFGAVPEHLVSYRVRAGSLSADPVKLFDEAERIIRIGHEHDPGLPNSVRGPAGTLQDAEEAWILYLYWAAATMILAGNDPAPLLERKGRIVAHPGSEAAADALFQPVLPSLRLETTDPLGRCRAVWKQLDQFLADIARVAEMPGLDRSIRVRLDRRLAKSGLLARPYRLGLTQAIEIDVSEPLEDLPVEPGVERLHAAISIDGEPLGAIELPVCEGSVPAWLLADAIADRFAWTILGRFFERGRYRSAVFREERDGTSSAYLDNRLAATRLPPKEPERTQALHDQAGWQIFLDELWHPDQGPVIAMAQAAGPIPVEVTAATPSLNLAGRVAVEPRIGGWPVGVFEVPGSLEAGALRELVTVTLGYELCRVATRESIIGRPLGNDHSLRERLTESATGRSSSSGNRGALASPGASSITIDKAFGSGIGGVALGRRPASPRGTAADRRALLPYSLADWIVPLEQRSGTPSVSIDAPLPGRLAYLPELRIRPEPEAAHDDATGSLGWPGSTFRFDFESTFVLKPDPWRYGSEYEQVKYRQTLDILPNEPIGRALELACAEGHFTVRLAGKVSHLVATDISEIALARAAGRCRELSNVDFQRLDLRRDPLPTGFDLVVCSEVLYYLADEAELRAVAAKLAGALAPGGYLLTTHAKTVVDEPDHTGFQWTVPFGSATIARVLRETPSIRTVVEFETPLYRILLYRDAAVEGPVPKSIVSDDYVLPREEVAAQIRWTPVAAKHTPRKREVESDRLPILMYHRIAESGEPSRDRYRVTPAAFAGQLEFLRDCGFRTISLEEWRRATLAKRPIPGRPIIITFDDGFADFEEQAWPLLERFGFRALVFLVTGSVGRWNEWDNRGTEERLLDWPAIERLHSCGVEFGAHGVTHRRSTGLTPHDLVREAIGSRAAIEEHLGSAIRAFAYPYGDEDEAAQHLVGGCGFSYGLTTRSGSASLRAPLLALPRIEIAGDADLAAFVAGIADARSS
jgi:glycosyltransferase involved in cell wall biosynthesis/peptidoglycan/xylan/chitin deacetylase (PgdA/CDA1 family)/trans-aconitate methyltransferase